MRWLTLLALLAFAFLSVAGCGEDKQASARCNDGTLSYSENRQGTCSWHEGVAEWNPGSDDSSDRDESSDSAKRPAPRSAPVVKAPVTPIANPVRPVTQPKPAPAPTPALSELEDYGSKALAISTLSTYALTAGTTPTCEGSGSKVRWHCTTPNSISPDGLSRWTVHITPTGAKNYVTIGFVEAPSEIEFRLAQGEYGSVGGSTGNSSGAGANVIPGGQGYAVTCGDGSISMSGGIQGACSQHGGVL